jgi:hypothetical protein
MGDAYWPK